MFKNWEIVLYFLTAFFCAFVDDLRILLAIVIVDVLMLLIVRLWCGKLLISFDMDQYVSTKKLMNAAEVCLIMAAIFALFSLVRMAFYMIFMPADFFSGTLWLGYLIQILPTLGLWMLFHRTKGALVEVEKKKSYIDNPPSKKLEDFYAFSDVPGVERAEDNEDEDKEKEENKEEEPAVGEIPDLSSLIAETVPDEDEFRQHLQLISLMSRVSEPAELWECPGCGSLNPAESGQCGFCGIDRENGGSPGDSSANNDSMRA